MNSSQYKKLLEFNQNLILYGPPGTGKTFKADKISKYMTANQNNEQGHTWKTITSLVLLENNGLPLHYNEISKREAVQTGYDLLKTEETIPQA